MTPNVGDMIESFHKLWDKIENNHVKMSSIEDICHQTVKNVQQSNEYSKTLEQLTSHPRKLTRIGLVSQIKMEQRYSGVLMTQNSELKIAIKTHRKALEQIMGKYREQMKLLKRINMLESRQNININVDDSLEKRYSYLEDAYQDLPVVISQVCDNDLVLIERQQILIEKIRQENARMRRSLTFFEEIL